MSRIHTTTGLLGYATLPILKQLRNWWLCMAESHYLICADVEKKKSDDALENQKHYQTKAALARSARI